MTGTPATEHFLYSGFFHDILLIFLLNKRHFFGYTGSRGDFRMMIYSNEYLEFLEKDGKVFLKTLQAGFSLKDVDGILRTIPRIRLTNFAQLKHALQNVINEPVEIGSWLPSVELEIAKDNMSASIYIHEESIDFEKISSTIKQLLDEKNIVHGIIDLQIDHLIPGKPIKIAQGTEPIKGDDAQVTYLEIPDRKPVISEDGKADFFEMNFIFEIKEGDWLGEKIVAKPGIEGKNIFGNAVPALPGNDVKLNYDPKSAYEVEENGKIVLYASKTGAVESQHGVLTVNNHLPINGDVGVETGNIKFDGSVSIRGTVANGFSVIATGDISIEGAEGITGAKLIKSENGDIYIRGGIFGVGETEVEAEGNVYVKHVNDANIIAKKDIVIGFYSLGSNLTGNSILLDERKGKVIGGKAIAKNVIVTAISGNRLERRTELIIDRLNKKEAHEAIQEKAALLKAAQTEVIQITSQINQISQFKDKFNQQQLKNYNNSLAELEKKKENIVKIDNEIKKLMDELSNVRQEEVIIKKEANPGTYIQIGTKSTVLNKISQGNFKIEFGELNV